MDKPPPISRRSGVEAFHVLDVLRKANDLERAGHSVVHLEAGQPAVGAPEPVLRAAKEALGSDRIGYTEALGRPALRERIAEHYREYYGVRVATERIAVTAGSSAAFVLSFLACFEPGDRVGLEEPGYPAYRNILRALGVEPVPIRVGPETNWSMTPDLVRDAEKRHGRLAGLLVASPANPTGTMLSHALLKDLIDDCEAAGRWFISDEIYHRITFGDHAETALALSDQIVVVNSFSKYYAMTGWRLGWMVMPERLERPVETLAQHLFIAPPTLSQVAAVAAFDATEELDGHVRAYADNRALLLGKLPEAGIDRFAPSDGTFYLYADVSTLTNDSAEFCRRMLNEAHVATTPGIDFDPDEGHKYVRISFAGARADMEEAARRLKKWLKGTG